MLLGRSAALAGALALSTTAPPPQRSLRMGLIDWMLENEAFATPMQKLCRAEGWDAILRMPTSAVSAMDGPRTYTATLNVGLRFYEAEEGDTDGTPVGGSVELKSPVAQLSGGGGTWRAIDFAPGGTPTAIQWRMPVADGEGISAGGISIVAPGDDLCCTMPLNLVDGNLLRNGVLQLQQPLSSSTATSSSMDDVNRLEVQDYDDEAFREIGTASFSPMPLMGSN